MISWIDLFALLSCDFSILALEERLIFFTCIVSFLLVSLVLTDSFIGILTRETLQVEFKALFTYSFSSQTYCFPSFTAVKWNISDKFVILVISN